MKKLLLLFLIFFSDTVLACKCSDDLDAIKIYSSYKRIAVIEILGNTVVDQNERNIHIKVIDSIYGEFQKNHHYLLGSPESDASCGLTIQQGIMLYFANDATQISSCSVILPKPEIITPLKELIHQENQIKLKYRNEITNFTKTTIFISSLIVLLLVFIPVFFLFFRSTK